MGQTQRRQCGGRSACDNHHPKRSKKKKRISLPHFAITWCVVQLGGQLCGGVNCPGLTGERMTGRPRGPTSPSLSSRRDRALLAL